MHPSDRSWQALEVTLDDSQPLPDHAAPINKTIATVVHEALWTYDCGPVTYLSVPGVNRQRTLLRAGTTPSANASPPELPPSVTAEITDATACLAGSAYQACPKQVGLGIVDVDTTPVGRTNATTQRLLVPSRATSISMSTTSPPLAELLAAATQRPHALSVVATRGADGTTEIVVRFVDFSLGAQTYSRDTLAQAWTESPLSIGDVFEQHPMMTTCELLEEGGWQLTTESRLPGEAQPLLRKTHAARRDDWAADRALALALSSEEYAQVFRRAPGDPLATQYESLNATGRLTPGTEQLPGLYPVLAHSYPQSVWRGLPGRAPIQITPVAPVHVPETMSVAETDPTATASRQTPTGIVGECSGFTTDVARWCLERGKTIRPAKNADTASPFEWTTPHWRNTLAYPVADAPLQQGQLIAATWQAHHDPTVDGLTVFTATQPLAAKAVKTILQPFKRSFESTPSGTILYRQNRVLEANGNVAVRSVESSPERWAVMPDNELQCIVDETVVASGSLNDSLETMVAQLPHVTRTGDTITLTQPATDETRTFESREAVQEVVTPIREPARPAHLATGLETATVRTQDGPNFRQYRGTASWDHQQSTFREAAAAETFLDRYTVTVPDETLSVAAIVPEFVSSLRHQTDEPISHSVETVIAKAAGSQDDVLHGRSRRYMPLE